MLKAFIFGAGPMGKGVYERMKDRYDILGFWDNDKNKQGKMWCGVPVYPPGKMSNMFDMVIIASSSWYEDIYAQLINDFCISPDRIIGDLDVHNRFYSRLIALKNMHTLIEDRKLHGNVAELGVFQGAFAREINRLFCERTLYLFDTFNGFESEDLLMETRTNTSAGEFTSTSVELVLNNMPFREKCIVKKGWFPETAVDVDDTFVFVSLDADLYSPIFEGLKFFYPRLIKGGCIFVHDFFNARFDGVKKAVYEYSMKQNIHIAPVGDNCSIIITK